MRSAALGLTAAAGRSQDHLAASLGFLEASNTVEILRAAGPGGLHAEEIARRIVESNTGADAVDAVKLSESPAVLVTLWLTIASNRPYFALPGDSPLDARGAPGRVRKQSFVCTA